MSVTNHKCPNCSANLPFNPEKGLWVCDYCNSEFTEEQLNAVLEKQKNVENSKSNETKRSKEDIEMDLYRCPSCGAQIITDKNTTATFCVYCKNPTIIKERFQGEFNPNYILPFKKTKQDAINAFTKFSKGKIFAPKNFTDSKNINEISGIYIPFWVYTCDTNANASFKCSNSHSHRSGDYIITRTDFYNAKRAGTVNFSRVPADGSTKFDDNIMDSIEPYNYTDLKEFNMSYLSGFLSENYDVSKEETFKRADDRIINSSLNKLKQTVIGYSSVTTSDSSVEINNLDSKYALLPVWLLNTKYNDKIYTFALNGQTGKMVGNIPIDKKILFKKSSIFAGIVAIASAIISYFFL